MSGLGATPGSDKYRSRIEHDWTRSASAVFTTFGANVPITREVVQSKVEAAAEDGATVLMCFVQDEGLPLWPSRISRPSALYPGFDLVEELVAATHAAGLRFVAQWMGVHVQTAAMSEHPTWRQRDHRGIPMAALCLNSPFGHHLLRQISEVASQYPIDGVYLDGIYARQGGCYCPACVVRLAEIYGLQVDLPAPSEERRDQDHWLDVAPGVEPDELATLRFDTVTNWMARLRAAADRSRPGTKIVLDVVGSEAGFWPNGQDVSRLEPYVDVFALESYWEQINEPVERTEFECAALRADTQRPIWLLRWLAQDPDGDHVAVPSTTIELFASTTIVADVRPAAVEMNLYTVDDSARSHVRSAFQLRATVDSLGHDLASFARVAVLNSLTTRRLHGGGPVASKHRDAVLGAWAALKRAHVPVTLCTEENLHVMRSSGIDVIVVPSWDASPPAVGDALEQFVADGGGLVSCYRSAPADVVVNRLLGLVTRGIQERAGRIGSEALGGSEPVTYARLASDQSIIDGLDRRLFSFAGPAVDVAIEDDGCLGWLLDGDPGSMQGDRWFGWYPGEPASALGYAREIGAGRVVYFAPPIDALFHRAGAREPARLLYRAVEWAGRNPSPVAVSAPTTVSSGIRRSNDGSIVLVALANRTTNQLYAIGARIPVMGSAGSSSASAATGAATARRHEAAEIITLPDTRIRVAGPIVRAGSLLGTELAIDQTETHTTISIPRLGPTEAVLIQLP